MGIGKSINLKTLKFGPISVINRIHWHTSAHPGLQPSSFQACSSLGRSQEKQNFHRKKRYRLLISWFNSSRPPSFRILILIYIYIAILSAAFLVRLSMLSRVSHIPKCGKSICGNYGRLQQSERLLSAWSILNHLNDKNNFRYG